MGYGFSGRTSLKRDKHGNYNNSTKSCRVRVNPSNKLEIVEAWSYEEKIAFLDHKKKIIVYNARNFSPTTNNHFSAIQSIIESKNFKGYKSFYFDLNSLNGYGPNSIKSILDDKSLKYSESLFEAFRLKIFRGVKKLKEIENRTNEKIKEKKENDRLKTIEKKIENLNYKTIDGLNKAYDRVKKSSYMKYSIKGDVRINKVYQFKDFLIKNDFNFFYCLTKNIKNFYNRSSEEINQLKELIHLSKLNEPVYLGYFLWEIEKVKKSENKDFILWLESKNLLDLSENKTKQLLDEIKAIDCLNNLGD